MAASAAAAPDAASEPTPASAKGGADFWQVIGGATKGGILVREGRDASSTEAPERLATGSLVRQLALEGERLQYSLVLGTGPATGWVSVRLSTGAQLLRRTHRVIPVRPEPPGDSGGEAAAAESGGRAPPQLEPVVGRGLRILALHGSASNSNILNFQTLRFKKKLGKEVTWLTPEGLVPWERAPAPPGALQNNWYEERTDAEKMLAKNMPFMSWLDLGEYEDGFGMDALPESAASAKRWFREYIAKEAPIDIVVAFSQGADLVNKVLTDLYAEGQEPPWRLNLFFSPAPRGRYDRYFSPLPTWVVTSPQAGPEHELSVLTHRATYPNLTVLEHEDGHAFPSSLPRATEIYEELAAAVRRHCLGG